MSEHQDSDQHELPREVVELMLQRGRRERAMLEMLGDGRLDRAQREMSEERDR